MCDFQPPRKEILRRYAKFLEKQGGTLARDWGERCNNDFEGACCEADTWGLMSDLGVEVQVNTKKNPKDMSVDFFCERKERAFYVEATCIKIDTMSRHTGEEHYPTTTTGVSAYSLPTLAVHRECKSKAKQCSGWDLPCLLVLGTYHFTSSRLFAPNIHLAQQYFTGELLVEWTMDFGEQTPEKNAVREIASGKNSAFLGKDFSAARQSISAVLLVGMGHHPPTFCGLLHSEAARPFDSTALPRVTFFQGIINRNGKSIRVDQV